ncbi:hypothetical protein ACOSQ3_010072 [Xanthoceras sorbifolium]
MKIDEGPSRKNINVLTDIDALSGADATELGLFESQLRGDLAESTLKHIMMYAQASLLKGNTKEHICLLITLGFIGVLAGWWDDLLTKSQKTAIKSATRYDHSQHDHMGNPMVLPDMVNTLIYKICLHFVVFQRKDSSMDFWKERFHAGLPTLFAERVRTRIKNKFESSSSSEEEEQCNCDHYKSILKLNGLSINMLRQEDSLILNCIDAIDDPEKKRSAMEKLLAMAKVVKRVQNEKAATRQPTVTELRAEMNSYKKELHELKRQQQSHNQQLQDYDQRIQACESLHSQVLSEARLAKAFAGFLDEVKDDQPLTSQLNGQLNKEEAPPTVNHIEKIIVQKWYSKVTIIVSKAFVFEGEALIDSGADLNCISEGIIPSQYFFKTTQMTEYSKWWKNAHRV